MEEKVFTVSDVKKFITLGMKVAQAIGDPEKTKEKLESFPDEVRAIIVKNMLSIALVISARAGGGDTSAIERLVSDVFEQREGE